MIKFSSDLERLNILLAMFVPVAQSPSIVGVVLGRLISGIAASTGSTLVSIVVKK